MPFTIATASSKLREHGFYRVTNLVVLHHLLKDFSDYNITNFRFYIKPVGIDFVHVALIEYDTGRLLSWEPYMEHPEARLLQVRYTCAGDDLLYGLRTKFPSGGSVKPEEDVKDILALIQGSDDKTTKNYAFEAIRNHPRYIRPRFRHGRTKAKIRAFFQMLKDNWSWLKK
jgi:hypothetical protein